MPPSPTLILATSLQEFWNAFVGLPWMELLKGIGGQVVGLITGFVVSWFILMRKRRLALNRMMRGDSDDILFQSHHLAPIPGTDKVVLLFRNVAPGTKVDRLYDNTAANDIIRKLAEKTTLHDPVLQTKGTLGYEVLNDAFIHIAGQLAITPFERETWLFTMTCEDRQVVRRRCIRCFLIRPEDLEKFANWDWCRDKVQCEQPWHWYRIVALHQIAKLWKEEKARGVSDKGFPLIDDHVVHNRVREMSAGICAKEEPVGQPATVPWAKQEGELKRLGLQLSVAPVVSASAAATAPA